MGILDAPAQADSRLAGVGYGPKAATVLQPWRAALAGRFAAPANIVVIGDSTEEGTGISTAAADRVKAWPDRLGQLLRYRYPTPGETQGPVTPNYVPVYTDSNLATGWTISAGWTKLYSYGPNATSAKTTVSNSTLTYTIPVGVSSIDIHHVAGSSITGLQYSIDGGSASATFGNTGLTRETVFRITGWTTTATHTLVITGMGTNSYVDGILPYHGNESSGIRVFNCGHHGSRAYSYTFGAVSGFNNWLSSSTPSASVFSGAQSFIAGNMNPDLLIVALGYNDPSHDTAANFATYLAQLVSAVRAMNTAKTIPVIYLDKWTPGPAWPITVEAYANYVAAKQAVAAADPNGLYVSLASSMPVPGSTVATQGSVYLDTGTHAVAKGYAMAADQLAGLLSA